MHAQVPGKSLGGDAVATWYCFHYQAVASWCKKYMNRETAGCIRDCCFNMSWKNCHMESVVVLAGCLRLAGGGGVTGVNWRPHLSSLCDYPSYTSSLLLLTDSYNTS